MPGHTYPSVSRKRLYGFPYEIAGKMHGRGFNVSLLFEQGQGWPYHFEAMLFSELCILFGCHTFGSTFAHRGKKGFHLSGRAKKHEHPTLAFPHLGKTMRNVSWSEDAVTRFYIEDLVSHPDQKIALKDIPPFILFVVNVQRRTARLDTRRFIGIKGAACIVGGDLGKEGIAFEERDRGVMAVFACRYQESFSEPAQEAAGAGDYRGDQGPDSGKGQQKKGIAFHGKKVRLRLGATKSIEWLAGIS